jgi:thioredoxin reductase (NADPH)
MPGGQINKTNRIDNYPGIKSIAGPDWVMEMHQQLQELDTEIKNSSQVTNLKQMDGKNIQISCDDENYIGKTVILSPGSDYRKLGIPGEDKFRNAGAGVSYCGTCDAPFFKGKEVVAVGGGNTALEETLHLTNFAEKVTLLHRRDEFRADKILVDELLEKANQQDSNLHIKYSTVATEINGGDKVESVKLKDVKTAEMTDYPCDGVFVFIGMIPNTGFLKDFVELTETGFIKADCAFLRTSVPGVFAAGDCRVGAAMQLVTAAADGAIAALMIKQYLRDANWWNQKPETATTPSGW